jgi:hypothetical protein
MPLVYFRSHTPGGEIDMRSEPVMNTAEAYSRHEPEGHRVGQVAYPTGLDPWLSPRAPWRGLPEREKQQHFIDILLHELAHTQQDPTTWEGLGHLRVEGGADAFAALARDRVVRRMGLGRQAAMPFIGGYGQLGNQFIGRFGGGQALYGQFGRRAPRFTPFLTDPRMGTLAVRRPG